MSKRKERLVVGYDVPKGLVMVTALDSENKKISSREYDLDNLPEAIRDKVSCYGLNKLLTDRTSDQKDKGRKLAEMDTVYGLLCSGEWAKERVVGAIVVGAETEAVAELLNISVAATQVALAQYTKEERAKMLARPDVQELAAKIRQRRKDVPVVTLDELLG